MLKGEITKTVVNYLGFETIDETGKKHKHPFVIRGNGLLTITADHVSFHRFFPKKDFMIPFEKIRDVSINNRHNWTFSADPVIKITFEEHRGVLTVLGVLANSQKDAKDIVEKILFYMKENNRDGR